MSDIWGTKEDAAHALKVSERTISRRIKEGEIKAKRFGNLLRVDMRTLNGDDADQS